MTWNRGDSYLKADKIEMFVSTSLRQSFMPDNEIVAAAKDIHHLHNMHAGNQPGA
jgi:hypothetical protein